MANKEFYKAEDLAKLLDVNIMTIYRYIKAGHLKIYKVGKKFSNSLPMHIPAASEHRFRFYLNTHSGNI